MKERIISLYKKGFSYKEIREVTGCSRSVISSYCDDMKKKKEKEIKTERNKNRCPIMRKISRFKEERGAYQKEKEGNNNTRNKIQGGINKIINIKRNQFSRVGSKKDRELSGDKREYMFSNQELKQEILDNPFCYLTGDEFDPMDSQAWSLDHIQPRSRGGTNEFTNAGQTTKLANQMKSDMTVDELHEMCKKILNHAGYRVEKITEEAAKKALNL